MNEFFFTVQVYVGDLTKYHMLNVYAEMSRLTIDNLNGFRKDMANKYNVPWEQVVIINVVRLERRSNTIARPNVSKPIITKIEEKGGV